MDPIWHQLPLDLLNLIADRIMDDIICVLKKCDFTCVYVLLFRYMVSSDIKRCYLEVSMYPENYEKLMKQIKQYRTIKLHVGGHFNDIEYLIYTIESLESHYLYEKITKYPMIYDHPKLYSSLWTLNIEPTIYTRFMGPSPFLIPTSCRWNCSQKK
jgi:hypothetical protein